MPQPYNTPEQMLGWNGNSAPNSVNPYGVMSPVQTPFSQGAPAPSSAIARRGGNNSLIASNHTFSPQPNDPWPGFADDNLLPNQPSGVLDEHDNIELLEERAQRAKREAQAKRKQIPPFVQKLNRSVTFSMFILAPSPSL
jgi:heat shock transcription factor